VIRNANFTLRHKRSYSGQGVARHPLST
jgi:hypothetical protein